MYRVFLSYNTSKDEMVVVWRLQTLAAASGLHLDVPNPIQRADWPTVSRMIDDSDAVIVFLTKRATAQVKRELDYSLTSNKRVIPIVEHGVQLGPISPLLRQSGVPVFELRPDQSWNLERDIATYLQRERVGKNLRGALLALAGTFVGLYLLQELTET